MTLFAKELMGKQNMKKEAIYVCKTEILKSGKLVYPKVLRFFLFLFNNQNISMLIMSAIFFLIYILYELFRCQHALLTRNI